MPAEWWRVGAATLPLVVLLVGLLWLHWRGTQAGIIALGVSAAVAAIAFAASPAVLGIALLRAVTGLPPRQLGIWIAALLGIASVATGFAVAHVHAGTRPYRRAFGAILVLGVAMGGTQLLLALSQHWIIASFGAGMVGLVVS